MKKMAFFLALLLLSINLPAQDTTTQILSKEEYLKKSKSQRTVGIILLAGGVGLFVGAASTFNLNLNVFGSSNYTKSDNTASALFAVAGLGAIGGSIACFASSHKNARKAASLTMGSQSILIPRQAALVTKVQPAICLRISI